jgi:hypothetical protein
LLVSPLINLHEQQIRILERYRVASFEDDFEYFEFLSYLKKELRNNWRQNRLTQKEKTEKGFLGIP